MKLLVISVETLLVVLTYHRQICKNFTGVVVDSSGNVYVSDTNSNLVQANLVPYLLSISIYASKDSSDPSSSDLTLTVNINNVNFGEHSINVSGNTFDQRQSNICSGFALCTNTGTIG